MTKIVKPRGIHKSSVWDEKLGPGKQHTIYAPKIFFEKWSGDDSELKRIVNSYLLECVEATPTTAEPVAKKLPADTKQASDDDF